MATKSDKQPTQQETLAPTDNDNLLDRVTKATMEAARPLEVDDLVAQRLRIRQVMEKVMEKDVHYGVIPGTIKPTLLQPGAQMLCNVFRMEPRQEAASAYDDEGHLTVNARTTLYQIGTAIRLGDGIGCCTTLESRYRYRIAARLCPACKKPSIIKGKEEFGGGWLCWKKKDGCGSKFADGEAAIEDQPQGQVENPNIADVYNTVTKISLKRSLVYAVLNVLAASDMFTQDMEDVGGDHAEPTNNGKPKATGKKDDDDKRLEGQVNKMVNRINKETTVDGLKALWETVSAEVDKLPKKESGFIRGNFNRRKTEIGAAAKPAADKPKYATLGEEVLAAIRSITEAGSSGALVDVMNTLNDLRTRLEAKKGNKGNAALLKSIDDAYAVANERLTTPNSAEEEDWLDGDNEPDGE